MELKDCFKDSNEKVCNVWKPLKNLDAEIRKVSKRKNTRGEVDFDVDIGLFESLGEQAGEILTQTFDSKPSEEEVIKEIKETLKDMKKEFSDKILSGREEAQLKVLRRII